MKKLLLLLVLFSASLTTFSQVTGTTGVQIVNDSPFDVTFSGLPADVTCNITPSVGSVVIPANSSIVTWYNQPIYFSFTSIRLRPVMQPGCNGTVTDLNLGSTCPCSSGQPTAGTFQIASSCYNYTFNAQWIRCWVEPGVGTRSLIIIN
jgi:hypothetical protein